MVKLNAIIRFLNKELNVSNIKDSSKNGLQVRCRSEVKRIAFGVDACMELFEKAKKEKCELVVVHHGLLWKGKKTDAILRKRITYLKKNKISLYAAHAPLDNNKVYGNNAELAKIVGAKNLKQFGYEDDIYWGYWGIIRPTTIPAITNKYNRALRTKGRMLNFGKTNIRKVGFGSGGCGFAIEEAKKKNLDLFVVGEIKHSIYHEIRESGLNVLVLGHYRTETLGVKALMPILKQKFNIGTIFIDIPTGM
jgi:dinuclear metal center YbgI/SA1388 family protein